MKVRWIDVNWWFCTLHWATLSHCRVAWWSYWRCVSPASLLAAADGQRRRPLKARRRRGGAQPMAWNRGEPAVKGSRKVILKSELCHISSYFLLYFHIDLDDFTWFYSVPLISCLYYSIFTSRILIKWSQNLEANLSITTRPPLWQRTLQTLGLS